MRSASTFSLATGRLARWLASCAAALPLAAALSFTAAQAAYPERPVTIVVAVAAGGTTDLLARALAERLTASLGQPFVVDNRGGAGGNIGMDYVAHAPADGYTLLLGTSVLATNPALYPRLNFNPMTDFAPISLYASAANLLVVSPTLPVHTFEELIAYAKANPDKLTHGSTGNGTTSHLAAEIIKSRTGIQMTHVPYKGGAPAMTDLLGGQISMLIDQIPVVLPYVKSGKVRAIGVTTGQRSEIAPEIPTIAEQGLPDYDVSVWFGVLAPAKTPRDIVTKLNGAIVAALKDPSFRERLVKLGVDPMPSTPEEFQRMLADETTRWAKIIKDSGAKVD